MARERQLPERRNPLIAEEHSPPMNILIERRRLGQTELAVKPGQVGTSNATKPDNLGKFDYAHLRVPLPKDLKGSGVISMLKSGFYPEAYFLMRRSNDGYISATGMFKAAFPWASAEEEEAEKQHLKSLPETGDEEIAGNVWIPPENALELADEYGMRPWILALLDPEPIEKGTHDPKKRIATPPRFTMPSTTNGTSLPAPAERSTRSRTLRSASPAKQAPPTPSGRKIATPRRGRRTRNTRDGSLLATNIESAAEDAASVEPESVNGDAAPASPTPASTVTAKAEPAPISDSIKVDMELTEELNPATGTLETHTHVAYLDQAKAALESAKEMTVGRAAGKKRKADEMLIEEEEDVEEETIPVTEIVEEEEIVEARPVKRVRLTEVELKKRRSSGGQHWERWPASPSGIAMIPVFMGTFFQAL
ncbi:hypothetical protein H2203_000871 [Taxawa tesnikishii (nom. ined.)]|nr:hypothetical protein H2203_000871 [Dothideales sp. JES 119]